MYVIMCVCVCVCVCIIYAYILCTHAYIYNISLWKHILYFIAYIIYSHTYAHKNNISACKVCVVTAHIPSTPYGEAFTLDLTICVYF